MINEPFNAAKAEAKARELRQFRGASAALRLLRALELDDIADDAHLPIEQVEAELRAQGIDIEALQGRTRKLIAELKAQFTNGDESPNPQTPPTPE